MASRRGRCVPSIARGIAFGPNVPFFCFVEEFCLVPPGLWPGPDTHVTGFRVPTGVRLHQMVLRNPASGRNFKQPALGSGRRVVHNEASTTPISWRDIKLALPSRPESSSRVFSNNSRGKALVAA